MQKAALALLFGSQVASKAQIPSIWDEDVEELSICMDHWTRWSVESNTWDVYKEFLQQADDTFEDDDFTASLDMIFSTEAPPAANSINSYKRGVVGFMRPHEIFPDEEVKLLGDWDHMKPNGIKQGSLADCWFLAGAAALAEEPDRLKHVIHANSRDKYNFQGVFRYYFWSLKEWVPVNIDDRLPVKYKYSNSKDYFVPWSADRSLHGAWWMPLLEKAYAKFHGNYDRIGWGSGFESLRQLTHKPVFYYQHDKFAGKYNEIFDLLYSLSREDAPMVVACCYATGDAPDGLVNKHAYTLLDVVDVKGTKLAKLRNPWSAEKYHGPWSDKDERWTPELLKLLNHKIGNDGIFFMPFVNFVNKPYFKSTSVALYREFANEQLFTVVQKVEQLFITITVPSKQKVYFTLEGENPRFKKLCSKDNTYINTFFFKGKNFPGMDKLLLPQGYLGQSLYHSTVGAPHLTLDEGLYTLLVVNWNFEKNHKAPMTYTITAYQEGSGSVTLQY